MNKAVSKSDQVSLSDSTPFASVRMTAVSGKENGSKVTATLAPKKKPFKPTKFQEAWDMLVEKRRAGHLGSFEYKNGGMAKWAEFLAQHPEYYVPKHEIALIHRCAHMSARLIGAGKKITLVSRGPGTKFAAKEGALIYAFEAAGIEVAKVVYIDYSKSALRQSVKEGRELLPRAEHVDIEADMFDPATREKYSVVGTEVGTCLGLTINNVPGSPDALTPPLSSIEGHLRGIRGQYRRKGGHFIATFDHNEDKKMIESAYAGQAEFALHMLQQEFGGKYPDVLMNTSDIDFDVKYFPDSRILGHSFVFQKDTEYQMGPRARTIPAGTVLWFNNSVKTTSGETVASFNSTGFEYGSLTEDNGNPVPNPVIDDNGRFGYHHVMAA